MINFFLFVEGLLFPLLGLGLFVIYKRSKRKKRKFHAPPTHQLPSWLDNTGFIVTQGMVLLLLKPLDLPPNFVLNLIIYVTNSKNNIGYEWIILIKF